MQIVPSTFIALCLVALIIYRGPYRGLAVLAAVAPMGMMAAFNLPAVGNTSIMALDILVLTLVGLILVRPTGAADMLRTLAPGGPGIVFAMFFAWAVLVTLFMPRIFAGQTEVFGIGRIADAVGVVIRPLGPSGGNLSQLMRMSLSLGAFLVVAALICRRPDPGAVVRLVKVATAVHVGMGMLDLLTSATNTAWLLDPVRTANYALLLGHQMAGLNRMIGGFPEASSYGYFAMGLAGFWLSYWLSEPASVRGKLWRGSGLWLAATLFVVLRSTSSSAYVALALFLGLVVLLSLTRLRSTNVSRRSATILTVALAVAPVIVVGAYALYELLPGVQSFIDRSLLNKLGTDSGEERMSWNVQALRNFMDTWGIGAGLGAVRASNWLVAVLATTGVVGAALILTFLARLFTLRLPDGGADPERRRVFVALKFACAGFLARALVVKASPNLDIFFFVLAGCAVGLASAYARADRPVPRRARLATGSVSA